MRVYFIRHGESVANLQKVMAGQTDMPLTALGREQAERVGSYLQKIPFDKVYASDLSRAMDTCRLALPEAAFETDARLREIDVGELVGLSGDDCTLCFGEGHLDAREQLNFAAYGGEDRQDLLPRIRAFLEDLEQRSYQNVAVFTHGGLMLALLEAIWGTPVSADRVYRGNCMVMALEYNGEIWSLYGWNMEENSGIQKSI